MVASFFEKLTGASSEEEIEAPKPIIAKKTKKITPRKKTRKEKIIKKDSLNMLKTKKLKEETEKPTIADVSTEETELIEPREKDWLEEAEGEEGQLTIDVYQSPSDIVIKSTVAGVNPEDIDISITNDMVTIRGKRAKDEKIEAENYYYQELYWGTFSRSVILPVEVDADKVKATIKNGILTIKLPKSEKVKTKKIHVRPLE